MYYLSYVQSLHNTTTKSIGFAFDSISSSWIQETGPFISLISITWVVSPFRRYGTPSSGGSNPLTLLAWGYALFEYKDEEFGDEGECGLGEEGGDGLYGGWIFPRELFAVGESKVEDDEV